jgi:hypothetical protein
LIFILIIFLAGHIVKVILNIKNKKTEALTSAPLLLNKPCQV